MRKLALVAAAAMLPGAAAAQGFYVQGGGGVNWLEDAEISGPGFTAESQYDTGWAGTLSFGYAWKGPRVELEGSYRQNKTDGIRPGGPVTATTDADVEQYALMANFLYDFELGGGFAPYLGAGLGAARVDVGSLGDDTVFAYQGIAGIGYKLSQNLGLFADYRYFATMEPEVTSLAPSTEIENRNHTVMIGLRLNFGGPREPEPVAYQPPPAAPAEPAPAPVEQPPEIVRDYLVFFDFDRADITPEASDILRTAAENAREGEVSRISVVGHADRSGSAQYNMRLSQRRADAVRRELERYGMAAADISTSARGESDPLVPTPDGVREPQNRRAQIVLN